MAEEKNNKEKQGAKVSNAQILKEIEALNKKGKDNNKDEVLNELKDTQYVKKYSPMELASQRHKAGQKQKEKVDLDNAVLVYEGGELKREIKYKRNHLLFWFGTLFLYLCFFVTFFVLYSFLPYGSNLELFYKILIIAVSALYACFSYAFFSLKYSYLYKYVKLLRNIENGIKETLQAQFDSVNKTKSFRDGVDFWTLKFNVWNDDKQAFFERVVYVDAQKQLPKFEQGQDIAMETQGNVLLKYKTK